MRSLHRRSIARLSALSLVTLGSLVVGCDDDGTTSSSGSSSGSIGGGGAASTTSGATTTSGDTASSSGSGFPGCQGTICGDGGCCTGAEECVEGGCLPACASGVRCGAALDTCCNTGEVCIADACVVPGATCLDWADCAENEFCEPTLGQCLPQPAGSPICEYKPPVGPLTPTLEWSWTSSAILPTKVQVINMPVVTDLDLDGTPDVVIVSSSDYSANGAATLRALDGATGAEKWTNASADVYLPANAVSPRVTPAAADLDGDGYPEIVTGRTGGGLIAFEHDGSFKWRSTDAGGVAFWNAALESACVAIADLEGNGSAEITVGGAVFGADGKLRFDRGQIGGHVNNYGAVSIVADLDGDGTQEIVGGNAAYRANGDPYWNVGPAVSDGYPAIADLDNDGTPELVVISSGYVRVQSATTGAVLAQLKLTGSGAGGPPTIADFDADGVPEIASAAGQYYMVFEYAPGTPATLTEKWKSMTMDLSSNRTGSSVFDFEGDGAAEVVYNDECYFRAYDGKTGAILFEEPNSSATIHEYPVVADVDGDNHTEVIVGANDLHHIGANPTTVCPYPQADARHGLFVFGDQGDNWVRTRKLWNQHAYHITNIAADMSVPGPEAPSWIPPSLNNYRQSSQGAGVFNAPDLSVSVSVGLASCPTALALIAKVVNHGSLGVAPGVIVRFYEGATDGAVFLGQVATTKALLPGQSEAITLPFASPLQGMTYAFYVSVDGGTLVPGDVHECVEDNNAATVSGVMCPAVM